MGKALRKRVLGWIWLGTVGGLASAGAFLLIVMPERTLTVMAGLILMGIGLLGLALQIFLRVLKRR